MLRKAFPLYLSKFVIMFPGGFNHSYNQYLKLRGFDPSASKLSILLRALIGSWFEPGFHNFWRVWHTGLGHILYRLYIVLGGNRFRVFSTYLVFLLCGMFHDLLVVLIFRQPFIAFTISFSLFGIITILNRSIEGLISQDNWPKLLNFIINVLMLSGPIYFAVQLQFEIFR